MKKILILVALTTTVACGKQAAVVSETSGNPAIEGWYADPEGIIFDDQYWIYPTFSDISQPGDTVESYLAKQTEAINPMYNIQVYFDAFSSKDLVNWEKHPRILKMQDISWAKYAMWAPGVVRKDDKYYLFFGANDIQSDDEYGGIGVAVADNPAGPFVDAIGKPLIDKFHNGAQPIDQSIFRDDDGQYYMYYGGWRHCNVVKLGDDLTSLVPFEDGETYKEVTPEKYVEGPFMIKRGGKYYFMWSEGGWGDPEYSVAYAIADSPTGPFQRIGKILEQDPDVATSAGHHSVIQIPGTDEYYIVYHRRPLGNTKATHRETCIDRMYFDEDGLIVPVKMTFEGVAKRELK